ncbi:MAG: YeeE/YedE thiosulfate transporter family protein [Salinivirgaceae bacterium]
MGPLVPDIISNEFNLIVALLVGIAFGFVLEQAGFSTTKKLVGLFYGYDFTVLKVFFTAGITAMIGVVLLAHFGQLDLDLIYVNPTFLRSAIIGGAIMGAGFIVGGFCPGTSICALATGKIDAFWFIAGSFVGIFIFMEFYPSFENFYLADNRGNLRMDKYFGMSKELFAIGLTAIAIAAFYFTQKIENKLHGVKPVYPKQKIIKYSVFAAIPFVIILFIAFTPSSRQRILQKAEKNKNLKIAEEITADKLAIELVNNYYKINLIDLRSPSVFNEYHLPLAINIPLDSLLNREWKSYFTQKYKTNIFYADTATTTHKAFFIAKKIGDADTYILVESTAQFKNLILNNEPLPLSASKNEQQLHQYRTEIAHTIL